MTNMSRDEAKADAEQTWRPRPKDSYIEPLPQIRVLGLELVEAPADLPYEHIDHPQHYGGDTPYEAIKVIEAWGLGFCLGNAVKYISRAGKKGNEIQDLEKAAWYLARRIAQLKAERG